MTPLRYMHGTGSHVTVILALIVISMLDAMRSSGAADGTVSSTYVLQSM